MHFSFLLNIIKEKTQVRIVITKVFKEKRTIPICIVDCISHPTQIVIVAIKTHGIRTVFTNQKHSTHNTFYKDTIL